MPVAKARSAVVLSGAQRLALFVGLVLVLAIHNVLLPPEGVSDARLGLVWGALHIGLHFGQPALLGMWGALGAQRAAVRLPGALLLAMLFAYTMLLAEVWFNGGNVSRGMTWQISIMGVGVFVAVQIPFVLLRRWRGWRLALIGSATAADDRRFGMLLLLGWITLVSVVFGLWRALPVYDDGTRPYMVELLTVVPILTLSCIPLIPLSALLLDGRQRRRWLTGFLLLMVACPLATIAAMRQLFDPRPMDGTEFVLFFGLEAGMVLVWTLALLVARASGWRMVRPKAPATPVTQSVRGSTPRFVGLLAGLVAVGVAFVLLAIEREPQRQDAVARAQWRRKGIDVLRQQGRVFGFTVFRGTEITSEQVDAMLLEGESGSITQLTLRAPIRAELLARLLAIESLESIGVHNTELTAEVWERLVRLPVLHSLNLLGVTITDADLAQIARMPALQTLEIDGTNISDAGVAELEQLDDLRFLTLVGPSGVTPSGEARLRERFPNAGMDIVTTQGVNDTSTAEDDKGDSE